MTSFDTIVKEEAHLVVEDSDDTDVQEGLLNVTYWVHEVEHPVWEDIVKTEYEITPSCLQATAGENDDEEHGSDEMTQSGAHATTGENHDEAFKDVQDVEETIEKPVGVTNVEHDPSVGKLEKSPETRCQDKSKEQVVATTGENDDEGIKDVEGVEQTVTRAHASIIKVKATKKEHSQNDKKLEKSLETRCQDKSKENVATKQRDVSLHECRLCKKRFRASGTLRKHEVSHDQQRFQGRNNCNKKYHLRSRVGQKTHKKKAHLDLGYEPKTKRATSPVVHHHSRGVRAPPKKTVKTYRCSQCDLEFPRIGTLTRHMLCHKSGVDFSCNQCHGKYKTVYSLKRHFKDVHAPGATRTSRRPFRPKSMVGQPYPCLKCSKEFRFLSNLEKHMRSHGDGRLHKCQFCDLQFKTRESLAIHEKIHSLKNNLRMHKCRICGKDNMRQLGNLRSHRMRVHGALSFDSEEMKPFACGICAKPHHTRGKAARCTMFGHDPSTLLCRMFKIKCSECPENRFGFHSAAALRKHWEGEHPNVTIPGQYRHGIYDGQGDLRESTEKALPIVTIPRKKAMEFLNTGTPPEGFEPAPGVPLFVELDLLAVDPVVLERRIRSKKTPVSKSTPQRRPPRRAQCTLCAMRLCDQSSLKLHLKKMHPNGLKEGSKLKCGQCEEGFWNVRQLSIHQKKFHSQDTSLNLHNRSRKRVQVGGRKTSSAKASKSGRILRRRSTPSATTPANKVKNCCTVNVNDAELVNSILENKICSVKLSRLD